MNTPEQLRRQAAALLEQADELQAKVPRTRDELAALARDEPELVTRLHEAGELAHLVENEAAYHARTRASASDRRPVTDHRTPAERALIEGNRQ